MQGDWPAQVQPTLREPEGGSGPQAGRADGRAIAGEPALRLPQGVGDAEAGRLASEQEAGASVVEERGLEGARRQAAKTAASAFGELQRERVHKEEGRAQGPRLELRLCDGPNRRRP